MGARARQQLVREVPTVLAGLLDVPRAEVQLDKGGVLEADLVVRAGGHAFVVDVLDAAAPGSVAAHAEHLVTAARKLRQKATPLLAVPYGLRCAFRDHQQVTLEGKTLFGERATRGV